MIRLFEEFALNFISFLPNLLSALIILIIGWGAGVFTEKSLKIVLKKLKIVQFIERGRPGFRITNLIPLLSKWAIYLVFIWMAVDVLQIAVLSETLKAIVLEFLPGLIMATVIIIVGYGIAEYVRALIEKSKIFYSDIVSKLIFWLIIYIAFALALPKIGIDVWIINAILLIIVACFGLGISIAIGLGMKDIVAKVARKRLRKYLR